MWGGVGKPVRRGAAGGGGGGGGPRRAGPWEGWLWLQVAPAWAVLPCSRPLGRSGDGEITSRGGLNTTRSSKVFLNSMQCANSHTHVWSGVFVQTLKNVLLFCVRRALPQLEAQSPTDTWTLVTSAVLDCCTRHDNSNWLRPLETSAS